MRPIIDPKELAFVTKTYERIEVLVKTAGCRDWQCAAIVVAENGETIGEGVNSPPGNLESARRCHLDKKLLHPKVSDKSCCVHAEQRAIFDAMRKNPDRLDGSTLYYCRLGKDGRLAPSGEPWCTICSKSALDAGVREFVLMKREGFVAYGTEEYNRISYEYRETAPFERPDLSPFLAALAELEKFKFVDRTMPLGNGRHENDAEHSWNLAMWALLLAPEYSGLDIRKCLEYALVHDLGELYAGDTYIYDDEAVATKAEREREGMEKFLSLLPESARTRLGKRFHDYEAKIDDESKFVYELDKIQPVVLIGSLDTKAWKDYGITKERLLGAKIPKFSGTFGLEKFLTDFVKDAEKKGMFPKTSDSALGK